ncbi:Carboxylic ester hydrolase [Mycena indigotica]|uniref:Carboxylic ester hydrolase n=1 Tax=Mycena indigotica TaxID=2126181 RepID=A0A8H6VRH9_9AGAR|nr:Carboxylic ester hydrolase [Mycena indigotica]KAF7291362.1 Carboxylic ester hydrolase [Mycena indigotica]
MEDGCRKRRQGRWEYKNFCAGTFPIDFLSTSPSLPSLAMLAVAAVLLLPALALGRVFPRTVSTVTPFGAAQGVASANGATRYAVRYATAQRWQQSVMSSSWQLPNGFTDPAALPLQCPQLGVDDSTFAEDCLSILLYVPPGLAPAPGPLHKAGTGANTLVWIHGGSFDSESSTEPGLDGSKLAVATNAIVAVIQYRLGALALLAPNGPPNLSVLDTMNALKFLGKVLPSFGGDASKITLAGQSSGAGMIRTSFCHSICCVIIQERDNADYGFLSTTTQSTLQTFFNGLLPCSTTDSACLAGLSTDTILSAYAQLKANALALDPSTGLGEPVRPVLDGTLVTTPLDSTAPFPAVTKPLLLTSTRNDAGPTIYDALFPGPDPIPASMFAPVTAFSLGPDRTQTVIESPFYPIDPDGDEDARVPLQVLGTDYIWRCSAWTLARTWAANGGAGKTFVGIWTLGATYPFNDNIPYCLQPGVVCHRDDIQIVFGTTPNPTPAQAALTAEIQMRYRAFLNTGAPNVPGLPQWAPATTTDVHAYVLGNGTVPVAACDPSFWGAAVQYDYQFYGI